MSRPLIGADTQVTVFLPHYDCAQWLERAMRSILEQTMRDLTLVVVDDASTDQAAFQAVVRRFDDPRLTVLKSRHNVGPYQLFNYLLPTIASPYVAFQDADDWSDPMRMRVLTAALDSGGWDILGSALTREDERGVRLDPRYPHRDVNRALAWRCRGGVTFGATTICRTDFLRRLGGYDGRVVGKFGADTDLVYRAVFLGKVGNLDDPVYHVMVRTNSLTTAADSGFTSPARRTYRQEIRRRFYRRFLRSKLALLRPSELVADPNESEVCLTSVE